MEADNLFFKKVISYFLVYKQSSVLEVDFCLFLVLSLG